MTDRYILHTHHHVLGQREPEVRPYLYKSHKTYNTLADACNALFFYDQRMYFCDAAWDHGFCSHIVKQQLVSVHTGLFFSQYAIDQHATVELPAGLYLYANPGAGSLKKIERQTGFIFSGLEKKGPNNELLLLTTKAAILAPDTSQSLFTRRVIRNSPIIQPFKSKGLSK
jgi:hypothetical protein